ncbi:transporter substrate-binding domain-containing protein [Roseovarius spongiae]|nr:transporter substrate-binding domain-containing protein [Roseovarius spongiae]
MRHALGLFALCLATLFMAAPLAAQQTGEGGDEAPAPLVIATKNAPPFAFMDTNGEWTGIAIDAVTAIARDIGREVEWREDTLQGMLDAVEAGEVDAAAAAISITHARESKLDFTFPYYTTGLGIAVDPEAGGGWLRVLRNLFTWQFAAAIATLSGVLLIAGAAVWLFERGRNEEFPRDPAQGLGDGFWWAAVTMTTVGYGDKSPRTLGGRIVGLIWMLTAMLIVASFTAAIAAALTVGSLGHRIQGVGDLRDYRVGVVSDTTGAEEMRARGMRTGRFETVNDAFDALLAGRVGAVVYDKPLMQWVAMQDYDGEIAILENAIGRQDYGIALPTDSPLREPMNRSLLTYLRSDDWNRVQNRHLGRE